MKAFTATLLFVVGSTIAQAPPPQYTEEQVDQNPWTGQPGTIRYTKTCETSQGSPRGKRQAQEPKEPNCYYHADENITPAGCDGFCKDGNDGKDAHRRCRDLNGTSTQYTCTKKPVFVPLGKYDICDRFPDNFRGKGQKGPWFNTVGSNYGCSSATCCLWFPPIKCADVPLVKYAFLPFEHNGVQYSDCSDQEAAEANSITAAEIFLGSNGQQRDVCIFTAELDENQEPIKGDDGNPIVLFKKVTVEFSQCEPAHSPAAGCCQFQPVFK